jgi:hypothetical protein
VRGKILLWVFTAMAGMFALVGLYSMRSRIGTYGHPRAPGDACFYVHNGRAVLEYIRVRKTRLPQSDSLTLPGFASYTRPAYTPGASASSEVVRVELSLWPPFLLFAAYPVFWFLYAPMRTARLRARNLCHKCRYMLVGNESGVCPECGEALTAGIFPRWRRILSAVLCAAIAGWLIEFVIDQISLEHRLAVWMIQIIGDRIGVWMITSTLRVLPSALICVGVYLFLSPERFPDGK